MARKYSARIKLICSIILLQMMPVVSYAQNGSVSLKNGKFDVMFTQTAIKDCFTSIEEATDYRFFYQNNLPALKKKVTFNGTAMSFNELMNRITEGTSLTFSVGDNKTVKIFEIAGGRTVSGVVRDVNGVALPGVAVSAKGTDLITATDQNGKYTLTNVPSYARILVFSLLGMKDQEQSMLGKTTVNVAMEDKPLEMDEAVVVGYGTVRKSDLTGSVAVMKAEDVNEKAITSIQQMLQGNLAGVQITSSSGAPGAGMSINIRGVTSISGSNEPLVVVDGCPYESAGNSRTSLEEGWTSDQPAVNVLSLLDPNDIASIEVLKDASSTAIYGSRGANGVILVTTKKGQIGRDKISYSFKTDISTLDHKLDVLDGPGFIEYANEAAKNSGAVSPYKPDGKYQNVNWQDMIYKTAVSTSHQVNVSGGTDRNTYSLMLGYVDQKGVVIDTEFKRLNGRFNFRRAVSKKFDLSVNMNATYAMNNAAQQSNPNGNPNGSVVIGALTFRPIVSPMDEQGYIDTDPSLQSNPYLMAKLTDDDMKSAYASMTLAGVYRFTNYLSFRSHNGFTYSASFRDVYFPKGTYLGDSNNGYLMENDANRVSWFTENTLTWNQTFNNAHRINAVVGFTWNDWKSRTLAISASDFLTDQLSYNGLSLASASKIPVKLNKKWNLASFLFRFNYTYKNRYLFTVTGRADGASRLAEGHKWAFFPSVAIGWNMHNERFIKDLYVISEMKLRASYGRSGNQNIGVGATQATLSSSTNYRESIGDAIYTRWGVGSLSNPNLTWEITDQADVGLDLGFYDNRLKFTFDGYYKHTHEMLVNIPIPAASGFTTYPANCGSIENWGVEAQISGRAISTRDMSLTFDANLSLNRNKVLDLGSNDYIMGSTYLTNGMMNQSIHITKVGYPVGCYYGYVFDGIYQNQDEIDNSAKDLTNPTPGDVKFKDINNDNRIDENDRIIIGNPNPDFIFGFRTAFSYKNFGLSFLIQGSIGQDVVNLNNFILSGLNMSVGSYNVGSEAWNGRWTGEGTSNTYPKPSQSGRGAFAKRMNSFVVEDASYVRIKDLTLDYKLPSKICSRIYLSELKFFATITNLYTFTNYSGYDPEVSASNHSSLTPGVDFGTIPQCRTYSLGFTIGF